MSWDLAEGDERYVDFSDELIRCSSCGNYTDPDAVVSSRNGGICIPCAEAEEMVA
jgi:formylmethanofuran dehydrogenase subunit E